MPIPSYYENATHGLGSRDSGQLFRVMLLYELPGGDPDAAGPSGRRPRQGGAFGTT